MGDNNKSTDEKNKLFLCELQLMRSSFQMTKEFHADIVRYKNDDVNC